MSRFMESESDDPINEVNCKASNQRNGKESAGQLATTDDGDQAIGHNDHATTRSIQRPHLEDSKWLKEHCLLDLSKEWRGSRSNTCWIFPSNGWWGIVRHECTEDFNAILNNVWDERAKQ